MSRSKISLTEAVQYIWYVSGIIWQNNVVVSTPYFDRESAESANEATSAESASICEEIFLARISFDLMAPERVRFTGVCQPRWSMLEAYMLGIVESSV